jgi:hypothetical protein
MGVQKDSNLRAVSGAGGGGEGANPDYQNSPVFHFVASVHQQVQRALSAEIQGMEVPSTTTSSTWLAEALTPPFLLTWPVFCEILYAWHDAITALSEVLRRTAPFAFSCWQQQQEQQQQQSFHKLRPNGLPSRYLLQAGALRYISLKSAESSTSAPSSRDEGSADANLCDKRMARAISALGGPLLGTILSAHGQERGQGLQQAAFASATTATARWLVDLFSRQSLVDVEVSKLTRPDASSALMSGMPPLLADCVSAAILRAPLIPGSQGLRLPPLPRSYTMLHGRISELCDGEIDFPALCLTCGLVLDAGGHGNCSTHSTLCTGDSGAFFLLQDCAVLLLHDKRACYFPSPYMDRHGERHKNFRGRPLFMDATRISLLNALVSSHGVPAEVVSRRSSTNRVIIVGYY